MIDYRLNEPLDIVTAAELYHASTLDRRRPVDDPRRLGAMLEHANLLVTAWDGKLLVGLARSFSDYGYVTYLADLAVRQSHQRQGIGRELIRRTRQAAPETMIVLLAAPAAVDYYPHLGFSAHGSAWTLPSGFALHESST